MTSKEWKTYKLSDFMEFNPRETLAKGTIAKKIAMENLQPFCRDVCQYEFAPYNGGVKFKNGDTIMARITPCLENGKTSKVNILEDNEIAFGSTEYIVFRKRDNISDENFIYYLVTSPKIREIAIKSMVGSSGRQRVQADVLADLELELPPLETQEKIARALLSLDDKIELNNKINQNLEQQAQAIFKSWFVDFEPFGGKMPEDWRIGKLGELVEITSGKRPQLKQVDKDNKFDIPIIGASNIMGYTNAVLYNEPILITGRVGTHGIINKYNKQCWPSDNTLVIKSEYYEYIYQQLKRVNFAGLNRGSTQPLITQKDLFDVPIVIPSFQEIKEYEQFATQLNVYQDNLIAENEKLKQLRDTLLPKLMSGEIDVKEVEV